MYYYAHAASITDTWNNLDPTLRSVLTYAVPLLIIYAIAMAFYMKNRKKNVENFKSSHPDASLITLRTVKGDLGGSVSVHSVDGQNPLLFNKGLLVCFYCTPGDHVLECSYTTSRPGVMHKTVTKTYGPTKLQISVEANRSYTLLFDPKAEQYQFSEGSDENR